MHEKRPKIRLFFDAPFEAGAELVLQDQAHYLTGVMRQKAGDRVELFNGRDGGWAAEITEAGKRRVQLRLSAQVRPQMNPPDLWLLFAPIKKVRTDFIVEKATELGASRILPVFTEFTNSERLRAERLRAHAVEAAEQCGGTFVPEIADPAPLAQLLGRWDDTRQILFCDESQTSAPVKVALSRALPGPWAVLIGPEGGFSPAEAEALRRRGNVLPVTLGPRILRADTAAVSALTAWQMALGDWHDIKA